MLHLSPIEPDCSGVLGDGKHIFDGSETQPTIEGPKLYKRNGYYYIFAPAGGVKPGWQTVLRSRNIWGPYEEKIVLHQGGSPVNGPHQGAWVDTPSGEDWFIHFQDVGNAGRIVHLQPMRWVDDWPVIGRAKRKRRLAMCRICFCRSGLHRHSRLPQSFILRVCRRATSAVWYP